MKLVFVLLLSAGVALAHDWEHFKRTHGKSYDNALEEEMRKAIFQKNSMQIQEHNQRFARGEITFAVRMNEFGDLTTKEFAAVYNGARVPGSKKLHEAPEVVESGVAVPTHVDWRTKGYVTPIKNQGQCGSCWAFSSTGGLEGQHFRVHKKLVSLSEQNLVDCVTVNDGCNGGWMDPSFTYIKTNKGIDTEASYPYTAMDGVCKFKRANVGSTDSGYVDLTRGSEKDLVDTCAKVGPISVAIDASHFSFQFYSHGIYYEPQCSSVNIDHAVLVVGYGATKAHTNNLYYIVKNSWGTGWGMKGYIWMSRDRGNNCAIATYATYPTEKK